MVKNNTLAVKLAIKRLILDRKSLEFFLQKKQVLHRLASISIIINKFGSMYCINYISANRYFLYVSFVMLSLRISRYSLKKQN